MSSVPLKVNAAISAYEAARVDLLNFRQQHVQVMLAYDEKIEAYNNALNEAKSKVRDNADAIDGPTGDFSVSIPRTVSALLLRDLLGDEAEQYLEEAVLPEEKRWVVKTDAYKAAVGAGIIPKAIVDTVEVEGTPRVSGPSEIGLFSMGGKKSSKKKR